MIENVIQINDYKKILNNNKIHLKKLHAICKEIGEQVEGNCFTEHLNVDNHINELISFCCFYNSLTKIDLNKLNFFSLTSSIKF